MKKTLVLCCAFVIVVACKETPKDYVTISGKITDKNSDSLSVLSRGYSKIIKVNEDGAFSDTLKIATGNYDLYDGIEATTMFLKNGFDINLTFNAKELNKTIKYTGYGAETSNYLANQTLLQQSLLSSISFNLKEEAFKSKADEIQNKLLEFTEKNNNIDSTTYANQKKYIESFSKRLLARYIQKKQRTMQLTTQLAELIGKPSPVFNNYENNAGGTTSLSDLKGKYVYVDVWATWCGPCKAEIPSLKKVEKAYHGKNIEFVSISVDKAKDHAKWKAMVAEKELGGIQLFADKDWGSDFVKGYGIRGIPRFILIDTKGNIVNADAPRPSSPKLVELLKTLNI